MGIMLVLLLQARHAFIALPLLVAHFCTLEWSCGVVGLSGGGEK